MPAYTPITPCRRPGFGYIRATTIFVLSAMICLFLKATFPFLACQGVLPFAAEPGRIVPPVSRCRVDQCGRRWRLGVRQYSAFGVEARAALKKAMWANIIDWLA